MCKLLNGTYLRYFREHLEIEEVNNVEQSNTNPPYPKNTVSTTFRSLEHAL